MCLLLLKKGISPNIIIIKKYRNPLLQYIQYTNFKMSDSEEDYMSDKLLVGCEKDDVRPGLLFNKTQKRQHELFKKKEEIKSKKPKSYHEQEKETLEKGLGTAISSDNKGFKLLEKMGYKSGTGLGKSFSGITEPVSIKTKSDTSGVGREAHVKSIFQKKIDNKEKTLKAKETEFRLSYAERRNMITLQKDYRKAQRICEDLDLKNDVESPEVPFFWSKQARDLLKKKTTDTEEEENESEEEEQEEEEEEEISDRVLCELISYLRRKYNYCMYCGDFVEETENEFSSCPGYFRKDHDD